MDEKYLFFFGFCFCLTTITFLLLSQRQREVLFNRFRFRGRRLSSATTPPRSLSPEKGTPSGGPVTKDDFLEHFPPQRREALVEAAKGLPFSRRRKIAGAPISDEALKQSIMPFEAEWSKCDGSLCTSTGISVNEIKALGDFPDYAKISGVPLPEAYENFDIDAAIPRPYRPFRWNYVQTMCMYCSC